MATLKGQSIASSFQDLVKRADTYSQTGTNIEIMNDSAVVQPTGLYLESGATTDNVGIGTATPNNILTVYDATTSIIQVTNNFGGVGVAADAGLKIQYYEDDASIINQDADGKMHLGCADSIDMTILASGNVGIGNTSPGQKLEIDSGSIEVGNGYGIGTGLSSPYTYVKFDNSGQNTLQLASAGDVNVFIDSNANTANGKFRIHKDTISAGTNELFRVQEDGNVGIGIAAPTAKLHVVQADNQIGLSVTQTATTDTNYPIAWFKDEESTMETGEQGVVIQADVADPSTGGAYYFISCWDDTASMGWLTAASATQINTAFTQASDVRYKKDIEDWDLNGLGVINSLKLRTFTYNDVGYKGKHDGVKAEGFIADEVYEVWKPGADGTPGQMKKELIEGTGSTVENNNPKLEDGSANPDYIAPEYRDIIKPMGVTEGAFIRPMIKAIQELSAKVEALENA